MGTTKPGKITDAHGHYVFGVDDGAESLEMSLKMIQSSYDQGVRHIFCTSHDSAHVLYYKRNLAALRERLEELNMDVTLHSGCEIYCGEDYVGEVIEKLECGDLLPMGCSKYVLLEFSPWTDTEEIVWCVQRIRRETEFEPIIAHMERYLWLQEDSEILSAIRENNLLVQINAYSLTETSSEGTKNFARKLLQEKLVTFIGSDTHGSDHRPVTLKSGVQYIYDTCDAEYADDVCWRNAERLLIKP